MNYIIRYNIIRKLEKCNKWLILVSFSFTHFSIIVWILIKGPNGPILGQFVLLLRELRDLTQCVSLVELHFIKQLWKVLYNKWVLTSLTDENNQKDKWKRSGTTHVFFSSYSSEYVFFFFYWRTVTHKRVICWKGFKQKFLALLCHNQVFFYSCYATQWPLNRLI